MAVLVEKRREVLGPLCQVASVSPFVPRSEERIPGQSAGRDLDCMRKGECPLRQESG